MATASTLKIESSRLTNPDGDGKVVDANAVDYENGTSGLSATDVQAAIDEVAADGFVTNARLGDLSVSEAKIGGGAVTSDKIGLGAVTSGALDDNAVHSDKIFNAAVTTAKIADDAVTADKLNPVLGTVFETGPSRDMVAGDLGRLVWFQGTLPTYELKDVAAADTGVLVYTIDTLTLSDADPGVVLVDYSGNGTTVAPNTFAYLYCNTPGLFTRLT